MEYKDIKYTPSLEPEHNYRSDIDHERTSVKIEPPIEESVTEDKPILDKIEETEQIVDFLPHAVKDTVRQILETIKRYTEYFDNSIKADKDQDKDTDTDDPSTTDKDSTDPWEPPPIEKPPVNFEDTESGDDLGFDGYDDTDNNKDIADPRPPNSYINDPNNEEDQTSGYYEKVKDVEIIEAPFVIPIITNRPVKELPIHYETFIEILEDYLNKLENIITLYASDGQFVEDSRDVGFDSSFKLDEEQMGSNNMSGVDHIQDELVKSSVIREQIGRLFNKMSSQRNVMMYLNQILATHVKYHRYEAIEYVPMDDMASFRRNEELDDSKEELQIQIEESLYNFYKQLDSSNKLLYDYMLMYAREVELSEL